LVKPVAPQLKSKIFVITGFTTPGNLNI